jgi:hypothetical protein
VTTRPLLVELETVDDAAQPETDLRLQNDLEPDLRMADGSSIAK